MRHHNAGRTQSLVDAADQVGNHAQGNRIEAGKRLVVQHDFRVERNCAGKRDAARHPAGQLRRHQVFHAAQTDRVQFQQNQIADNRFRQARQFAHRKSNIVEYRQIGKQRAMLEQHAHAAAVFVQFISRKTRQITSFNQNLTRLRMNLTRNQPHQRGFAAARTTHHGGEVSLGNAEIDIVQNRTVAIREGNVFHFDEGYGTHEREDKAGCILITCIVKLIKVSGNFQTTLSRKRLLRSVKIMCLAEILRPLEWLRLKSCNLLSSFQNGARYRT